MLQQINDALRKFVSPIAQTRSAHAASSDQQNSESGLSYSPEDFKKDPSQDQEDAKSPKQQPKKNPLEGFTQHGNVLKPHAFQRKENSFSPSKMESEALEVNERTEAPFPGTPKIETSQPGEQLSPKSTQGVTEAFIQLMERIHPKSDKKTIAFTPAKYRDSIAKQKKSTQFRKGMVVDDKIV